MAGSNFNQLNKNYYIQNSTVQINTGSGRGQSASGAFGPSEGSGKQAMSGQGGLTKIKRAVSKNFGGFGSKESSGRAGKGGN